MYVHMCDLLLSKYLLALTTIVQLLFGTVKTCSTGYSQNESVTMYLCAFLQKIVRKLKKLMKTDYSTNNL